MYPNIKTALVQTPLIWENPEANRIVLRKKIDELDKDTDLAVLPEMFTSGFTMQPEQVAENMEGKTLSWIREAAMTNDVAVAGSVVIEESGKYYNRLLFAHPDGKVEYYDKKHTFTLAGEDKVYHTGEKRLVVEYRGWKLCPMICYDLRFPVWARNTEAYDVLLFVANWPLPRISAWDTLLRARAVENLCYCIGVNRVGKDQNGHEYPGHSAVYGVLGEEIAFSDREEIIYATLEREKITHYRYKLRFLEDRDGFTIR